MTDKIIIPGRPDLDWYRSRQGKQPFHTLAKKFPKYVYGRRGNSALIHKIESVDLTWAKVGGMGEYLIKLDSPIMHARTICGTFFCLSSGNGTTCAVPKPDAVMCGRCNGEMPPFSKRNPNRLDIKEARKKLGCIAEGL